MYGFLTLVLLKLQIFKFALPWTPWDHMPHMNNLGPLSTTKHQSTLPMS